MKRTLCISFTEIIVATIPDENFDQADIDVILILNNFLPSVLQMVIDRETRNLDDNFRIPHSEYYNNDGTDSLEGQLP
jgi:hypothetical protein